MKCEHINVIGAGLAGCEAAYQAAKRGIRVRLYEMKPEKRSPAHKSDMFAELVCSNSLRSLQIFNAVGLLKEEMRRLDSLIMRAADATSVPAGASLAVDRDKFSAYITNEIKSNENIEVITGEVTEIPRDEITVVATGPLTSEALSEKIRKLAGDGLHFFDAAAPIVSAESINRQTVFEQSRYDKGEAAYINCPMTREEYTAFYDALTTAETAQLHGFEKDPAVFEGCMPVEVMAKRGFETLLFGPMKPVGLTDPKTGKEPFAAVQLRAENLEKTMYNIVGFQTHLTFPEQKRVFSMIPGLENAEFLRFGVMHRNTYINSPGFLDMTYMVRTVPGLFFAGQMTGVEGYVESSASGLLCGINAARLALKKEPLILSDVSVTGSMAKYVSSYNGADFQPMNANFGIIAPPDRKVKGGKKGRYDYYAVRALEYIDSIKDSI